MARKNKGNLWKALLWLIVGFGLGIIVGWFMFARPVQADEKVTICHCEPQKKCETLEVASPAAKRHLKEHKDDYRGACEEPTPTPEPEDNWVKINRPQFACGTNYITFNGEYYYKWKGEHYVKFIINGREPKVEGGEGKWTTSELTLAPGNYEIRAELWGYWKREWHLKASQDGKFVIDECPEPTPTPTETPKPEEKSHDGPVGAPQCTSTVPVLLPANPLVWRKGGAAIVQWTPTGGDRANIYYYEVQNPDNAHAVRDTENDGYVEIGELGGFDWTFGIQQANDCAGGEIVWIEDGSTDGWVLFTP